MYKRENYPADMDPEAEFEYDLPPYLQKDLDAYKDGLATGCSYMDCLWCELYDSINVAWTDGEIMLDHAQYLREKFPGILPRDPEAERRELGLDGDWGER